MNDLVREKILGEGASLAAFADLADLPEPVSGGFSIAISVAIALNPEIVGRIPEGPFEDYSREYNQVNLALDELGMKIEAWLASKGYAAFAITRDRAPYDESVSRTKLPHKTAARLAGLGWIGKNALLVTREFGSAFRLTTILTNAPLTPNKVILESKCGACKKCQEICPGGAIIGRTWSEGIDRDEMVNHQTCRETTNARGLDLKLRTVTCGLCFAVCPYTKSWLRSPCPALN
jgi:epoxyqueuosine reductase QueG